MENKDNRKTISTAIKFLGDKQPTQMGKLFEFW